MLIYIVGPWLSQSIPGRTLVCSHLWYMWYEVHVISMQGYGCCQIWARPLKDHSYAVALYNVVSMKKM